MPGGGSNDVGHAHFIYMSDFPVSQGKLDIVVFELLDWQLQGKLSHYLKFPNNRHWGYTAKDSYA